MENLLDKVERDPVKFHPGDSFLLVLLLLLLALLIGSLLGHLLTTNICSLLGFKMQALINGANENSPLQTRNYLRMINLVNHFMAFTIPSLAVAYFLYKRNFLRFLNIHKLPKGNNLLSALLFMVVSFPLAQFTLWLNQQVDLPVWAAEMEASAEGLLKSVLRMDSPIELLFNLLIVAVIPALGEELLFRGILQKKLESSIKSGVLAIWITAILFSAIHFQFEGFLPRMILGALLGYLYFWTNNLWVPIFGHFIFNGTQVMAQYFFRGQIEGSAPDSASWVIWLTGIASLLLVIGVGYYIYISNKDNEAQSEIVSSD